MSTARFLNVYMSVRLFTDYDLHRRETQGLIFPYGSDIVASDFRETSFGKPDRNSITVIAAPASGNEIYNEG